METDPYSPSQNRTWRKTEPQATISGLASRTALERFPAHLYEPVKWCGGWDLNPRTPAGQGPEPCAFDLAWQPPPGKHHTRHQPDKTFRDASRVSGSGRRDSCRDKLGARISRLTLRGAKAVRLVSSRPSGIEGPGLPRVAARRRNKNDCPCNNQESAKNH